MLVYPPNFSWITFTNIFLHEVFGNNVSKQFCFFRGLIFFKRFWLTFVWLFLNVNNFPFLQTRYYLLSVSLLSMSFQSYATECPIFFSNSSCSFIFIWFGAIPSSILLILFEIIELQSINRLVNVFLRFRDQCLFDFLIISERFRWI